MPKTTQLLLPPKVVDGPHSTWLSITPLHSWRFRIVPWRKSRAFFERCLLGAIFAARFKLNDFVEKKVAKKSFRQSVNKRWVSQLRTWARNLGRWAADRISNSSKPKTPKVIKVLELRSQYFVGDGVLIGCHDWTINSFWGHGVSSSGSTSDYGSRGSDFDSRKGLAFFISS